MARPGAARAAGDGDRSLGGAGRHPLARPRKSNGLADRIHRDAGRLGLSKLLADASERLVVLNPPFHSDAALHTGIAAHLFADAARVLAPGGELWCVWNSHLRGHRPLLERAVGPTRQIDRNPKFTVTASTRH